MTKTIAFLRSKTYYIFLALAWGFGLTIGVLHADMAYNNIYTFMRASVYSSVSTVSLMVVSLLPLLVCVACVYFSQAFLILPVVTVKAYSYSFCALSLLWTFGSAGWLICLFMLFSDLPSVLLLLWFSVVHISGKKTFLLRDSIICIVGITTFAVLNDLWIAPFLQKIMC